LAGWNALSTEAQERIIGQTIIFIAALQITVIAGPIGSKTARPIKIKQYR
jgi:hypothetical protein